MVTSSTVWLMRMPESLYSYSVVVSPPTASGVVSTTTFRKRPWRLYWYVVVLIFVPVPESMSSSSHSVLIVCSVPSPASPESISALGPYS